ncbi:hypothetical protein QBC46DRAFT_416608 [Diplogelasinospora grovesii]|uniref:Uncharacterized protein n=1 Tax=Diplogelasinospora grovesii TaxID=303347 RepID=A0AAN6N3Q6_9PEZI|nr:hypothetical protein QBC46DRAFT_416608 [Diplogelasinospora grovesii]
MLASIWSFLGQREEPLPSPPPVTITGVRIPADSTPAHLLPLTTISDSGGTDSFLFHVPDPRSYWDFRKAWEYRDLHRLDLQQDDHIQRSHHLRQKHDLQKLLRSPQHHNRKQLLHLRQRYLLHQQYHILQQQHSSCTGAYYVFYSFTFDDLPKNLSVPPWISDIGDGDHRQYCGDVFLVKIAPHKYGEDGWAAYKDIVPQFLDLLVKGLFDG